MAVVEVCPAFMKDMVKANRKWPGTAMASRMRHVWLWMPGPETIRHGLGQTDSSSSSTLADVVVLGRTPKEL